MREKYEVTQEELTHILGWGNLALKRYERGALIQEEHDVVLKELIKNESFFYELLQNAYNLKRISLKMLKRLSNINYPNEEYDYSEVILYLNKKFNEENSILNGFSTFDYAKLENLIGYIASRVNNLFKTTLNKYLWYVDFLNYKKTSTSITGLQYMRMQYGPVIKDQDYEFLLESKDTFKTKVSFDSNGVCPKIKILSKFNYDLKDFTLDELDTINYVIDSLSGLSVNSISDLSHKEIEWINTSNKELIPYSYAKDLKIKIVKRHL